MRYRPFPSFIRVVPGPGDETYFGLQVPRQPWLPPGAKNIDVLPMSFVDHLQLEIRTAAGSHMISRDQFHQLMVTVITISNRFCSGVGYPCHLAVIASGEIVNDFGSQSAAQFCSNGLVFEVSRLCIDLLQEYLLVPEYPSSVNSDAENRLYASSVVLKDRVLHQFVLNR
ncbi:MAG: hypothetical protein IPJ68_03535 [Candidatus Moraniibacteriota bacterium]|nr:MAG: hypothetical protein IPJ68_03535 [Candidatus Moranbacteria bacterium]